MIRNCTLQWISAMWFIALIALIPFQITHAQKSMTLKNLQNDNHAPLICFQEKPLTLSSKELTIDRNFDRETESTETDSIYCDYSTGTLFLWSGFSDVRGGPDLTEPLVTDRPDFTEASVTVGKDVIQLEFGYTYTYDSSGGLSSRSQSAGEPLLRIGMFRDWLELRLGVFPVVERTQQRGVSRSTSGIEDLYLGTKIALTPQVCAFPEMAIIFQATVPTGSNAFSDDELLPGINWLYSWEINEKLTIGGSTQGNRALDGLTETAYIEFAQSVTFAFSLTDEVGFYMEWYGFFPHSANTARVKHYLNGGFSYLVNDDLQLDVRVGKGLTAASDDYFFGLGASVRYQ